MLYEVLELFITVRYATVSVIAVILVYLVIRRLSIKEAETFEKRDN